MLFFKKKISKILKNRSLFIKKDLNIKLKERKNQTKFNKILKDK
jgi:hypothetical protein